MPVARRITAAGVWVVAALTIAPAGAYYHYTHYLNRTAPYQPVQEKFDLSALPNKTVTFFVSDAGPTQYPANDSFASVLSQIRQAAQAWNAVDTSDLRVAFGGLETAGTPQASPGGEIVFEEMPPGYLAYGAPTVKADMVSGPNGSFVPIVRSVVHLNRDLTKRPGPSYLESFFETVLHEMGHALGLQHTFTSSTMSTSVTRATTRLHPLDADDIAGISLLYPAQAFANSFGSISGRVTSAGQGVHLASVVAIRMAGSAVSALTNPDGTYRIDGLPPDTYFVYAHPLPPSADIQWPLDAGGQPVLPGGPTETLFYPGTRDPQRALAIQVGRGNTSTGIDFNLAPRQSVPIYDISTYSFFGQNAVGPAVLNSSESKGTMVARGNGITPGDNRVAAGLGVQLLGTITAGNLRAYGAPQTTLAFDLQIPLFSGTGPRHLVFTLPNDIYVLPNGLNLVTKAPPSIALVFPNPDGTVTIGGTGLGPDTRVFFDGLPGAVRTPFNGTDQAGTIQLQPPPGFGGQRATVIAYNSDGQNSTFAQGSNLPVYNYPAADAPQISVNPSTLPAGSAAMVEVTGTNIQFSEGQVTLGFGTNDVFVRRVWVMSPSRILANVQVAPGAPQGSSQISVISGFQTAAQPSGFRTDVPNPRAPSIALPVVNSNPNQTVIFPGAFASIYGTNLGVNPSSITVTLNDQPVTVQSAAPGQVNIQIPPNMPLGPAILRLSNGTDTALPVVVQIESLPPAITAVLSAFNTPIDAQHPVQAGTPVTLMVTNVDPGAVLQNRVRVTQGGSELAIFSMSPAQNQPGAYQIVCVLSTSVTGQQVPISVSVDGNASMPVTIPITPQ